MQIRLFIRRVENLYRLPAAKVKFFDAQISHFRYRCAIYDETFRKSRPFSIGIFHCVYAYIANFNLFKDIDPFESLNKDIV